MIGLDTNVIVRYLTLDDPAESDAAVRLIDSLSADEPGFISLVVVAELAWVLEASYKLNKSGLMRALEGLLQSRELVVESKEVVSQALGLYSGGSAGFVDYLIERLAHAVGCVRVLTFDLKAARSAGMQLLK